MAAPSTLIDEDGLLSPEEIVNREYSNTLDLWGIELADEQCKPNLQHSPWQRPPTRIGVPILGATDKLHHKEGSC